VRNLPEPLEPTELVAGAWQLRPWPAAYADLDVVLAERYADPVVRSVERDARLDGWRGGDRPAFAVREITTGRCAGEVVVLLEPAGALVEAWARSEGATPDLDAVVSAVRRWIAATLSVGVLDDGERNPRPGDAPAPYGVGMVDDEVALRRNAAQRAVTRWLNGHGVPTPQEWLAETAAAATEDELDRYGEDGEVAALEAEVATLLGKPAAVFMPSGIMAQQAALRSWVDRTNADGVVVHGLSHLVLHELDTLTQLHGLRVHVVTRELRPLTVADLESVHEPLAAVTVELPLRDAGYLLPEWDDLVAVSTWCREHGVSLHVDGARLWESQPFYDRPLDEIAALADSVYVSFYKALGGFGGAALAGPEDVVAQARRWQRRHGGNLFSLLPYAVAARDGLRTRLPRMADYRARAIELAARVAELDGVRVTPSPPQTNAFRVFVDVDAAPLREASLQTMERDHVDVSGWWAATDVPGWTYTELTAGDATLAWSVDEQVAAFGALVDLARSLPEIAD
jgi:threonine aldolase